MLLHDTYRGPRVHCALPDRTHGTWERWISESAHSDSDEPWVLSGDPVHRRAAVGTKVGGKGLPALGLTGEGDRIAADFDLLGGEIRSDTEDGTRASLTLCAVTGDNSLRITRGFDSQ